MPSDIYACFHISNISLQLLTKAPLQVSNNFNIFTVPTTFFTFVYLPMKEARLTDR